jgi:hypothetical protein
LMIAGNGRSVATVLAVLVATKLHGGDDRVVGSSRKPV